MWIAAMESEHFTWQALGTSEVKARQALADGWDRQMRAWGFDVIEVEVDDDNIQQALADYIAVRPDGDTTFCGRQAVLYYEADLVRIPTGGAACDGRVIA